MSYCRWNSGDLYVYPNTGGYFTCHDCPRVEDVGDIRTQGRHFVTTLRTILMDHLLMHHQRGDEFPRGRVVGRLEDELISEGEIIKTNVHSQTGPVNWDLFWREFDQLETSRRSDVLYEFFTRFRHDA